MDAFLRPSSFAALYELGVYREGNEGGGQRYPRELLVPAHECAGEPNNLRSPATERCATRRAFDHSRERYDGLLFFVGLSIGLH